MIHLKLSFRLRDRARRTKSLLFSFFNGWQGRNGIIKLNEDFSSLFYCEVFIFPLLVEGFLSLFFGKFREQPGYGEKLENGSS